MEKQLIKGCIKGDIQARGELYAKYAPKMMSICLRYVRDRSIAEDLLQDGFIRLFERIHTYKGEGSFEGWMRKIFVNKALEYIRRKKLLSYGTEFESASLFVENDNVSAIELISADELMQCITDLPVGFRTVFNMFAIEGYSHAEIAKQLGIKEGTSRSQYARARIILQEKIKVLNLN